MSGHRETWPVRAKGFRRWIIRQFFDKHRTAPSSEALNGALNVIEAKAHYDGEEIDVGIRVAGKHGKIYLDLGDTNWRTIEIDDEGWRFVDDAPVRFRRAAGMLPLPLPQRGGKLDRLRQFMNVKDEGQFVLAVSWLLAALRDEGPYPVLALAGEQGSAKSTLSKLLRWLIDPNSAPLRSLPREDRDLFVAANNGHVLVFDNVSGLPAWISDTLCRLSTGGGFSTRTLYSDQDETLFDAQRPIILNGIEDVVERPDLADRSLFLTLEPIPKGKRRQERELMDEFEVARPAIMGALLDAMVAGLSRLPNTYLRDLPRMADFATWVTACEGALWQPGTFIAAYTGNISEATKTIIEGDIVASAIVDFMASRESWIGTAKELLEHISALAGEKIARNNKWPKTPHAMGGRLRRLAPSLQQIGLKVQQLERHMHSRPYLLEWKSVPDRVGKHTSFSSSSSQRAENSHFPMTIHDEPDDDGPGQMSCRNPLKTGGDDEHVENDDHLPPQSGKPCAACDDRGCPTCRPEKFGLPWKRPATLDGVLPQEICVAMLKVGQWIARWDNLVDPATGKMYVEVS